MLHYLVRRLINLGFVLLGVSFLTFLVAHLAPGDPVQIMLGFNRNPELYQQLRHSYGLDKPFAVQYGTYLWNLLHGDFGMSFIQKGQAVSAILRRGMPVSLLLGLLSLGFTLLIGLPLGTLAAIWHDSWLDNLLMGTVLTLYAIPNFVLAPSLIGLDVLLYNLHLPSLPVAGWGTPAHLVLPVVVYTLGGSAYIARLSRNSVLEVLNEEYVRTARSKGLTNFRVIVWHVLRNALIPVVTYIGPATAFLISGSFVIEYLFAIPGIGYLAVQSLYQRDYPIVVGVTIVLATAVVFMNLLTDLAYSLLDPRIRY